MEVLPSLVLVCETENHAMDEGKKKSAGRTQRFKMARDGIEPPTRGFSVPCSTY